MSTATAHVIPLDPTKRTSTLPVDPLFLDRWSPRALSPEPISERDVQTLFEAARWAPSASNQQPWMFLFADDEAGRARVRSTLAEFNQQWANTAPLLVVLMARKTNDKGEANDWAGFDSGAAWMSFALQARKLGLYAHAMGGFDEEKVYEVLQVDRTQWAPMAVIAVGRHGNPATLPPKLQAREKPNERKPLEEIVRRIAGT
ncbi:MAG: nitroreductase family protein [Myxococcales bacterium]